MGWLELQGDPSWLNQVEIWFSPIERDVIAREDAVPDPLQQWWEPSLWSLHSAAWWRRHWDRTGIVDVKVADSMPDGWQRWLKWQHVVAPENHVELEAVATDRGAYLGYVRVIGHRVPM